LGYESGRFGENGTNNVQSDVWCSLKIRTANAELNRRLGIKCATDVVRRSRLQWFGHVERKDIGDWVSACRSFEVNGVRDKGRGTWNEFAKKYLVELG